MIHNADVRAKLAEIKKLGIYKYHIAYLMGVNEATFSRWLRKEMNSGLKQQILTTAVKLEREVEASAVIN